MKELALQNCRLDGHYDIFRLLGRGSYAEIYVARDNSVAADSPHKFVVVKALNVLLQDEPDADLERTLIENFQNEAVALDLVRHPNIISRLGHGTARDLRGTIFHYLVLEYLPGGDLAQLSKREPLSFEQTVFYLEQVCAGLDFAHSKGVIHRDIKPQNLLLTEDRRTVKIADFGVARFAGLDSPITRVGTNIYAAPEHSPLAVTADLTDPDDGKARLTPAADVYSLAKTVYVLAANESPRRFANQPITDFPFAVREKPWSKSLLRVLEKATQTDAAARYQSVRELWQEIWKIKIELEQSDAGDSPTEVVKRAPLHASSVEGFTARTPDRPEFESMRNVQIEPSPQLPTRTAVVVEIGATERQKSARPTVHAPRVPSTAEVADISLNQIVAAPPAQTNSAQIHSSQSDAAEPEARRGSRAGSFFKRLIVAAVLLAAFSAVLAGTYNYLQSRGMLPAALGGVPAQTGVVNTQAFFRSSPGIKDDNKLGIVSVNTEVRILNKTEDGRWYEAVVVKQGTQVKDAVNEGTRGWIGVKVVDLQ